MLLWTYSLCGFSQNVTLSGKITDNQGEPLAGVTLQLQGTTHGTVTDFDGNYSLPNVPPDATLDVTYVGMHRQIIPVNGRKIIDIILLEDTQSLEEVVVVEIGRASCRERV